MSDERLLRRIRQWSRDEPVADAEGISASIIEDLSHVYNTRRGTVLIDPDFGLPDFTNLFNNVGPAEIEFLTRAMIETTHRHEPRLQNVVVRMVDRPGDLGLLRFSVNARFEHQRQTVPVAFQAILQGDGSVAMEVADG